MCHPIWLKKMLQDTMIYLCMQKIFMTAYYAPADQKNGLNQSELPIPAITIQVAHRPRSASLGA